MDLYRLLLKKVFTLYNLDRSSLSNQEKLSRIELKKEQWMNILNKRNKKMII